MEWSPRQTDSIETQLLKAQMEKRRNEGQTQNKWLREEGDDTWETRIGQDNNYQQNHEGDFSNVNKKIRQVSVSK